MAVGMLMQLPGYSTDFYDRVMTNLDWGNVPDPPGMISHYAGTGPDGLVIFDVWESQEAFESFAQTRLFAAIGAATDGNPPDVAPVFVQIHREEHASS